MKQPTSETKKPTVNPMQLLARIIPILGPVPTMISVYDTAVQKLHWNIVAAGSAALLIELLGYFSVNLAERMWTHNKGLRLDEKAQKLEAPTWKSMVAAALYLVVVEAMIVLVDVNASAAAWLPVTLPFAGIIGSWVVGMYVEQDARERTVREWREKKAQARKKNETHSGEGADAGTTSAVAVRANKKRSTSAGAPSADALRAEGAGFSAQYACKEPQCGWSPSVDALVASAQAGKSARGAAASSKAGHMKNRHPKQSLVVELFSNVKHDAKSEEVQL